MRNGYFSVALGTYCAFAGTACTGGQSQTNSAVDFNQDTLWLSADIGGVTAGTPTYDGELLPMKRLASSVYALQAENANSLGGVAASGYAQLAGTQTFTAANLFQPTANVTGVIVKQTTAASPTADIFNTQTTNGTNVIQVTGPALNEAAVTVQSVGATRDLTLQSGSGTVKLGSSTALTTNAALTISSGAVTANSNLTVNANGTGTLALDTTGAGTVNVATASETTLGLGNNAAAVTIASNATLNVGNNAVNKTINVGITGATANTTTVNVATSTGATQTVNIGSSNAGSGITLTGGASNIGVTNAGIALSNDTTLAGGKSLTFTSGTGRYIQTYTGTTTDALSVSASALTTASALKVTSTNNSAANTAWSGTVINATNAQGTTAVSTGTIAGLDVQFTQSPTIAGNTETAANFALAANAGSPTDSAVSSILNVTNNDTATGNLITAASGLLINAATASNITNAITLNGTFGTNLINTSTGNFTLAQSGALTSASTLQGTTINATTGFQVAGVALASANLSDSANLALLNGTQTFTNPNTFSDRVILNGTVTTASTARASIGGTLNSSAITNQYGLQSNLSFTPTGASLNNIFGVSSIPVVSGSALNIGELSALNTGISTAAGYTGQLATAYAIDINSPIVGGSQLIPDYRGIHIGGVAANGGNTSGTINNHQLRISANTSAAAAGGTLNNYGVYLTAPSASGAGTTNNYGLYVTGGAAAAGNYSIYNGGVATNYFQGTLTLGTTANAGGYQLNVAGDINATTGSVFRLNGVAGAGTTCSGGTFLQNQVVAGGITTGGTCTAVSAAGAIVQAPATTAANTITPVISAVVGLTVNGTNTGTAAQALIVNQNFNADATNINITGGSQTNGLAITRTNAGTLTNGLSITNTSGTLTNGINIQNNSGTATAGLLIGGSGTYTNSISAPSFSVTGAGAVAAVGINSGTGLIQGTGGLTVTGTTQINAATAGTTTIGSASGGAVGIASSAAVTITAAAASVWSTSTGDLSVQAAANLNLGNGGGTAINIGTNNAAHTIRVGNAGTTGVQDIGIGSAGNVGNLLSLEAGTAAGSLAIGNGSTAHSIQIGTSGTSTQTIVAGSANAGSTTKLVGGASSLNVANAGTTLQSTTNSTTAFQVQNASGAPVLLVDSTTSNLISNPGFEVNTTGWAAAGAGTGLAIAQNVTPANAYYGISSLQITTASSAANSGAQVTSFTSSITPGTYTLSFYAKATVSFSTFNVTITGGGAPTCLTAQTLVTAGFQRYSCSFTSTTTNVTAINFITTTATQRVIYLDAVQLISGNSLTPYDTGNIQLRGIINNPAAFQSASDSTSAFQIQNSAGTSSLFVADTLNSRVGVGIGTPLRTFHAAENSAQVASPMELLEQQGSGDATIELKNPNNSFFVGLDSSNSNGFVINSRNAAAPPTGGSPGSIALVQSTGFASTQSPAQFTTSLAFASAPATGNLIVVAFSFDSSFATTASCSDSLGNTYAMAALVNDAAHTQQLGICYAANIIGGAADTVYLETPGNGSFGADFRDMMIHEYSGASQTAPLDVTAGQVNAGSATANATTSGNVTTTQNNDLVFGAVRVDSGSTTITAGTSPLAFTQLQTNSVPSMKTEGATLATAGATAANWTLGAALSNIALTATFKAATTGTTAGTLSDTSTGAIMTLSQSGAAAFQNSTNSQAGFKVSNAAGATILAVDTTNKLLKLSGTLVAQQVTSSWTDASAQSHTESGSGSVYYVTSTSTTTNSSFNSTVNITGVPNVDGAIVFITNEAQKGTTSGTQTHTTIVQINGTTMSTVTTASGTANQVSARTFTAVRINGVWRVAGTSLTSAPSATGVGQNIADLAEWIHYTGTQPQPGDVLMLGDEATSVTQASGAYRQTLIGVVTTTPAQVYGTDDGHSVAMALTGRVPVRVSLENGPIVAGDYLTSSSNPGVAMRASQPGKAIGIALGGYDGTGAASVMTQLSTAFANPAGQSSGLQGSNTASSNLNVGGNARISGDLTVAGLTSTTSLNVADEATIAKATLGSLSVTGDTKLANLTVAGSIAAAQLSISGLAKIATLEVASDLSLGGHLITGGITPTLTAGAAACAEPTITVTGTDTAGTITIKTGTGCTGGGELTTLTFARTFGVTPHLSITPTNQSATTLQAYIDGKTPTSFKLLANTPPTPSTTYTFDYLAAQ